MPASSARLSDRRPTLVVGIGQLGRQALERLLVSADTQGALRWRHDAEGTGAQRLQNLALVHVPDRIGAEALDSAPPALETSALLGDLYRHIEPIGDREDLEQTFRNVVVEQAEFLLSASGRAHRNGGEGALPIGLDLIIVAHPGTSQAIGQVDRLLGIALDALSNNANLMRDVAAAQALHALEILDFTNYWDRAPDQHQLRRAVADSLAGWQARRARGLPSCGRAFLVDGRTDDGIRDLRHRIDEIALFLELLLFEGLRGERQDLWQPPPASSPLGTFGVRVLERGSGLLRRLAAARFATAWLAHLAADEEAGEETGKTATQAPHGQPADRRSSSGQPPESQPPDGAIPDGRPSAAGTLAACLEGYRPAALDRQAVVDPVALRLDQDLRSLERQLFDHLVKTGDLAATDDLYAEQSKAITGRLAAVLMAQAEHIRPAGGRIDMTLRHAIDRALSDSHDPMPLGRLIAILTRFSAQLQETPQPATEARAQEPDGSASVAAARHGLAATVAAYQALKRRRAGLAGLRRWGWASWAAVLATGATQPVSTFIAALPAPDESDGLLARGYAGLLALNRPPFLSLLLFAGLGLLAGGLLQRSIARRQARAERQYVDPQRGRLIDRLRAALAPTGGLGAPFHQQLALGAEDLRRSQRNAVHRRLEALIERLENRRREILWLRDEVSAFADLHASGQSQLTATGIRLQVERGLDAERLLARNPPNPGRFRSAQAALQLFRGWHSPDLDTFLSPLTFLDRLGHLYDEATLEAHDQPVRIVEDLRAFASETRGFGLAFAWKAQDGLPADRRTCLLPAAWRNLVATSDPLAELDGDDDHVAVASDNRAYVLRLQLGVDLGCLTAEASGSAGV